MNVTTLYLKNFRCFAEMKLSLAENVILITGSNGSGKSSLIEALHYACYLRSFRTYNSSDLIADKKSAFLLAMDIVDKQSLAHTVNIGFSPQERLVKINNSPIHSYKKLLELYQAITISVNDIFVVQGGPEERRTFIDGALTLLHAPVRNLIHQYRHVLEQRNSFLKTHNSDNAELYAVWTDQLWQLGTRLVEFRLILLEQLNAHIAELSRNFFDAGISVSLQYAPKKEYRPTIDGFLKFHSAQLAEQERKWERSCFGPHLDDIIITFDNKSSRSFASRGQQKLIAIMLKIAVSRELVQMHGSAVVLLDDFFSELDQRKSQQIMELLQSLHSQLIITAPESQAVPHSILVQGQHICLDSNIFEK